MARFTRREALAAGVSAVAAGKLAASTAAATVTQTSTQAPAKAVTRGRLKQSVSRWCYKKIPELREALRGRFRDHHALLIRLCLDHTAPSNPPSPSSTNESRR